MEIVEEGKSEPKIDPKQRKSQEIVETEEDDRISALPDCLLLQILSYLPSTKFAIRTGTLSKRWEHLWTLVPTLIFEHNNYKHSLSDFVSLVNKTLIQCRQSKLKKFKVTCTSCIFGHESHINHWIRHAVRCNVEESELMLWNQKSEDIWVDQSLFMGSCFTDLRLSGCRLNTTREVSWNHLKSLSISCGLIYQKLMSDILSGSPVLETLVLDNCYGYRWLDITSKSLKNLIFCGYNDPEREYDSLTDIIEIYAPNIISLIIKGILFLWKMLLQDVPSLVEAELEYFKCGYYETTSKEAEEEMLKGFILNLRHVKVLKIGAKCSKVLSHLEAKGFVSPSNIKFVESD